MQTPLLSISRPELRRNEIYSFRNEEMGRKCKRFWRDEKISINLWETLKRRGHWGCLGPKWKGTALEQVVCGNVN